ncbi:c-type cytochrome biogenesis protein CcmI [Anianabacter salinae]|uniref:c-type cytochrome biogenesis protein CcmI n=1 Tax=Anianabacter salinae TaxID=2851023 RepID=UPI00225E5560|nr:c-type cytochrome biogenesis protein CcmI [Anianabacter salinae]MBV0911873.1 c-type cytochrome biogenesis protein CcmI [Anianabacter salinae]
MLFWIVATVLSLAVAGAVLASVLRRSGEAAPAEAFDVAVYRDQLAEVDRDLARGVVSDAEADRLRTEVSRRLLAADKAASEAPPEGRAPKAASWIVAGVCALVIVGGGLVTYARIGSPGYADLPLAQRIATAEQMRADRPGQAEAEAEVEARSQLPDLPAAEPDFMALMERLRGVVAERPDDVQGLQLLARNEARLGNFRAAADAAERILSVKGDAAEARDYANYADLLILAAGGYVSPEAEAALQGALARDGANGTARYYYGLMYAQTGRPDLAFRIWRSLLADSAEGDPWTRPVRDQIEDVAARAGVDFTLADIATPPASAAPGPTREQMEAAGEMSAEDRQAMIRGMVDGLAQRLGSEGGPPEDWARLIGALGVLGDTDRAAAIWAEAQSVFADAPDALAAIRSAAQDAGVAE